jgi:hypothetical protein
MNTPKHSEVTVPLSDQDGNIFFIIGRVSKAMRRADISSEEREQFAAEVMNTRSYDEALEVVMRWVETT